MDATMFKTSLHYAEIPVLLQYLHKKKMLFEGGLVPEILLAEKEENQDGIIPDDQRISFHRFSLEATGGAGYFLTDHLIAGVRYTYSLYPARKHASSQTLRLNWGQRNNVLSFTLYYHFH
jgi:opacity protein-like surface antigen